MVRLLTAAPFREANKPAPKSVLLIDKPEIPKLFPSNIPLNEYTKEDVLKPIGEDVGANRADSALTEFDNSKFIFARLVMLQSATSHKASASGIRYGSAEEPVPEYPAVVKSHVPSLKLISAGLGDDALAGSTPLVGKIKNKVETSARSKTRETFDSGSG